MLPDEICKDFPSALQAKLHSHCTGNSENVNKICPTRKKASFGGPSFFSLNVHVTARHAEPVLRETRRRVAGFRCVTNNNPLPEAIRFSPRRPGWRRREDGKRGQEGREGDSVAVCQQREGTTTQYWKWRKTMQPEALQLIHKYTLF